MAINTELKAKNRDDIRKKKRTRFCASERENKKGEREKYEVRERERERRLIIERERGG